MTRNECDRCGGDVGTHSAFVERGPMKIESTHEPLIVFGALFENVMHLCMPCYNDEGDIDAD